MPASHQVHDLITQTPEFWGLLLILACKFFLAGTAIGLGIPGGIIGPIMIIGMLSGVTILLPLASIGDIAPHKESFALLGLAGMFCASLHAPLAALTAVMELSYSPQIILPAMLVIVPAYVTSKQLMKNSSIFVQQLEFQALPYTRSSVIETLQKTGVLAVMDRDYRTFQEASEFEILNFLNDNPTAPAVQEEHFELGVRYSLVQYDVSLNRDNDSPLVFHEMQGVQEQATLAEVYEILNISRRGAVYIYSKENLEIIGIITWNNLQSNLMKEQY